jgi:TolB-like protein/Flp pilus assembly protein TadD
VPAEGIKSWLKGTRTPHTAEEKSELEALFDKSRIAVLPFSNISPDANDAYFADGVTDEIISALSKIQGLKVVSRTSIMSYKQSSKTLTEIARELKVGFVLEGTVRKAQENLRITAQLLDAKNDEHVWSEDYDRKLENVFAIQADIATNVADALKVKILAPAYPLPTRTNAEAYSHYLKGRFFWNQRELDGFKKAIEEFTKASELSPDLAQAYAGLADTYLLLGRNGHFSPAYAYPKAIENARKAILLDEKLADPHVALAAIRQEYEWKWAESEKEFKHALELNPSNAPTHAWYALYLGHVGRIDEAVEEAKTAQDLDPLSPRIHCGASEEYLFAREYDNSVRAANRALEINPSFGPAYGYRAYAYVEKRMYDNAISDLKEAGRLFGARAWLGRLGHVYGISGHKEEADKIIQELLKEPGQHSTGNPFLPPAPTTAMDISLVYLGLGENAHALDWLEKAAEERTAEIIHIKCEPIYDPLQSEPRHKALMKKIGLV